MRKIVTLGVVLLAVLLAAPAWSQEAEPEGPQFLGELEALALRYALQEQAQISGEEQAQIRSAIRNMAQQMLALGYGEPQIAQAALQGLREALQTRASVRAQTDNGTGIGDLLRTKLRDQLRLAECDQTQQQLQTRTQDHQRTGTDGLVAGPPVGAGGPGGGGSRP